MSEQDINEHADIKALKNQIKNYEKRLADYQDMAQSLRESQDRYRTVIEHTGTATFVMAPEQTITMVNSSLERLTGLKKDQIEGCRDLSDLIRAPHREQLIKYYADRCGACRGPEDLALTIEDVGGAYKDVLLKLDLIASTGECVGSMTDISQLKKVNDRKNAEQALRENEIHLLQENIILRTQIKERKKFGNIVGQSAAMQQVYEHIINAGATDATVILFGEPGTGKELVAHAIHEMSERRNKRFVPVHCGAIPENLIESEFFGYKKGAFSGALTDKAGYLEYADGGTLFLDEVGEISPHMQVKLLRVIEGGGYTPVGDNQNKTANVRIIAATNRDLQLLVKNGLMREDFFYRIHILPLHLPPLRERKDDLPLLIKHFMDQHAGSKRNVPPVTAKLMEKLHHHDWPGNVRELQNVIIRYCNQKSIDLTGASSKPEASSDQMSYPNTPAMGPKNLNEMLAKYEKLLIQTTLNQNQWHRQKVASALSIDRKTLFNKMKRYGLLTPSNMGR
jgi:PAS domain S-box-containing protein